MNKFPACMMPDGGDPCEAFTELQAEIERLRAIADTDTPELLEQQQEIERLQEALGCIARTTFSGSETNEYYMRGNRHAHETCARIARAALAASEGKK